VGRLQGRLVQVKNGRAARCGDGAREISQTLEARAAAARPRDSRSSLVLGLGFVGTAVVANLRARRETASACSS
jgi:hypothetical protein